MIPAAIKQQIEKDDAVEMFEIAKRILDENKATRMEIESRLWEPKLWFQRQRLDRIVIWYRPAGFSEVVLVATDNGDGEPTIMSYRPMKGWLRALRRAARIHDATKSEPVEFNNDAVA